MQTIETPTQNRNIIYKHKQTHIDTCKKHTQHKMNTHIHTHTQTHIHTQITLHLYRNKHTKIHNIQT